MSQPTAFRDCRSPLTRNQFKALSVPSKGAGASMKDIEIVAGSAGPTVSLKGDAALAAGGKTIKVSLSHSDTTVVAFAVAQ